MCASGIASAALRPCRRRSRRWRARMRSRAKGNDTRLSIRCCANGWRARPSRRASPAMAVECRLLWLVTVKPAGIGVLAILLICGTSSPSWAQIDSRFAAGVDFLIAATGPASTQDHAHSQFLPEPVFRFGRTDPGWGARIGLNWYSVDIDRPV